MLDLGWPEILVIAIVLIVVVGPKDLPGVLRGIGRTTSKMRSMAGDFRKQFDEALREAELDDVKGLVDDARRLDPRRELRKHLNPLEKAGRDIRSGLDEAMKPKAKPAEDKEAASKAEVAAPKTAGATGKPGEKAAPKKASSAAADAKAKTTAPAKAKTSKATAAKTPAKAKASAAKSTGATAKAPARAAGGKTATRTGAKGKTAASGTAAKPAAGKKTASTAAKTAASKKKTTGARS